MKLTKIQLAGLRLFDRKERGDKDAEHQWPHGKTRDSLRRLGLIGDRYKLTPAGHTVLADNPEPTPTPARSRHAFTSVIVPMSVVLATMLHEQAAREGESPQTIMVRALRGYLKAAKKRATVPDIFDDLFKERA